jgi:hypothetical protein
MNIVFSNKFMPLIIILISTSVVASELTKQEKEQRKIVQGIYHLTDGALAICPKKDAKAFKDTLTSFKKSFPKVMLEVSNSPHLDYAKSSTTAGSKGQQKQDVAVLSQQCLFKQKMLMTIMSTEEGRLTMERSLHTLTTKNKD